jgi:AAA15 family ATPase/GTPase
MLLRFSVSNYNSFKDEVSLNMMPVKSRTMKDHIISDVEGKHTEVLPIATIYGANASGKSNLVSAMEFARKLILTGTRPDNSTGVKPFLLDNAMSQAPSRFEFTFKHEGIIYTYGFVVSAQMVHEEWLFGYFTNQESKVFERVTTDKRTKVVPGSRLLAEKKQIFIDVFADGTRPNQLFLTEAHEKNIDIIKPVMHWFREHLQIIRPNTQYMALALRARDDKEFTKFLANFLRLAGTGIDGIQCISEELKPEKHLHSFPPDAREIIEQAISDEKSTTVSLQGSGDFFTIHRDANGVPIYVRLLTEHHRTDGLTIPFETTAESDGTRRLMHLAPMLLDVWGRDRVFVIDELDRSLHTYLSRLFLQTCLASITAKHAQGQFILTTHDTNLLDRNLLRRDEIWFMEKDVEGASHLTSLAEYKVSEGLNYENGYLNGRFGAIPFIGNISDLLREEE